MNTFLANTGAFCNKNLPIFLSIGATAGVVGTAVLAAKEAPMAAERYLEVHENNEPSTKTSIKAILAGLSILAPAIGVGAATIGCIWGVNGIYMSRYTDLLNAFGNLSANYSCYKAEAKNVLGEAGAAAVVAGVAKKNHKDDPIFNQELKESKGETEHYFYDSYSDTFFISTWKEVLEANLHLQDKYNECGVASLNDYYKYLNMDTPWSVLTEQELVWDSNYLIEQWDCYVGIPFSYDNENRPSYMDDGTPYYTVNFDINPVPYQDDGKYEKFSPWKNNFEEFHPGLLTKNI